MARVKLQNVYHAESFFTRLKYAEGRIHLYENLNAFISDPKLPSPEDHKNQAKLPIYSTDDSHKLLPRPSRNVAVKDNIATVSESTTCASRILEQYSSPFDASVIEDVKYRAGNIVGKTNMDEFGMGSHSLNSYFGAVRHHRPFGLRSVGGSSGGSAVAVATSAANIALGTDTGGSVRLPAAYTGTAGFKPSYGIISRYGVVPYANSLDTVGVIARSSVRIRDFFPSIRRYDHRDPTSLKPPSLARIKAKRMEFFKKTKTSSPHDSFYLKELKVGVPIEYNISELDLEVSWAWQRMLKFLQRFGCTIVPISLPNTKHALSAYYILAAAEASSNLSKYDGVRYGTRDKSSDGAGDVLYSKTRGAGFGDEVKRRILLGSYSLSSEALDNYFIKAQKVRRLVQRDFDRVFSMPNYLRPEEQFDLGDMDEGIPLEDKLGPAEVDIILCPTAPTLSPLIQDITEHQTPVDVYMNDIFTVPASLAGIPSVSIPCTLPYKFSKQSRPSTVGIQIMGQHSDDGRILQIASMIEMMWVNHIYEGWKKDFDKWQRESLEASSAEIEALSREITKAEAEKAKSKVAEDIEGEGLDTESWREDAASDKVLSLKALRRRKRKQHLTKQMRYQQDVCEKDIDRWEERRFGSGRRD
ncbi:Trimeric GatFAB AmidoTransferase(AdT) complex subunit [Ciborinia camelliae]|nr:Trimeric GatFAB AmidoTransferase(AdT) complex subunit [Ciborinia camelliae]